MSRLRAFLAGHARDIAYWIRKLWWVVAIVVTINSYGTWLAIDHANANAARQQRHSNQQAALQQRRLNQRFQQAQILANHKFQQGIRISIAQSSYAQNKSACGFRSLVGKARQRANATLAPGSTAPEAAKTAARQTLSDIREFLETQVTVPSGFKCSTLPKNPPRP